MRNEIKVASLMCLVVAMCHGAHMRHARYLCDNPDWELHATHHFFARKYVFGFGQFPFWCPYLGGGYPVLLNPEGPYFSPSLLLTLLLGEVIGLKVYAVAMSVAGVLGMYFLLRARQLSRSASAFGALALVLGTWFSQRTKSGNLNELHYMLFPALAWSLHSRSGRGALLWGGLLFATIVVDGKLAVPVMALMLLVYVALHGLSFRRVEACFESSWLRACLVVLAVGLCIALARLVTTADLFFGREARPFYRAEFYSTKWIRSFGPQAAALRLLLPGYGWFVSDLCVGPVVVLCALYGLARSWSRCWRIMMIGCLALVLVAAHHFPIDFFRVLYAMPPFCWIQMPGKYFDFFIVFAVGCMAAEGAESLRTSAGAWGRRLVYLSAMIGLVPLAFVSLRIDEKTYHVVPDSEQKTESFKQLCGAGIPRGGPRPAAADMYRNIRRGIGTIDFHTPFVLPEHAIPAFFVKKDNRRVANPDYRGEAFVEGCAGTAAMRKLEPNRIVVHARLNMPGTIVVNQNFDRGWRCTAGATLATRGLLSARIDHPGELDIVFRYRSPLALFGMSLSAIAAVLWMGALLFPRRGATWARPLARAIDRLGKGRMYVWSRTQCRAAAFVFAMGLVGVCAVSVWLRNGDIALEKINRTFFSSEFERVLQLASLAPARVRNHPVALKAVGVSLLRLGRPSEALATFSRLAATSKLDAQTASGMGSAYLMLRKYEKADEMFEKTIALDPYGTEGYVLDALALLKDGRLAAARKRFMQAHVRGADDRNTWEGRVVKSLTPELKTPPSAGDDPRGR